MKKISGTLTITVLLISSLLLSSCNLTKNLAAPPDEMTQKTSVAQTVIALQTELAANATPAVPVLPTPTIQILPTNTVAPPPVVITLPPAPIATAAPTYKVGTTTDVTIPDDTVMAPNTVFKKTWRLTNAGTAIWNSNFKIIFSSGNAMGAPATKEIGQVVNPGQTVDISLDMTAPAAPNTYRADFMLQTGDGANFGLGPNATGTFWVKIKVVQNFAITAATVAASPTAYTGACPGPIALTASITSTAPGTVTYYFDTATGPTLTQTVVFDAAGTKTTTATVWNAPATGAYEIRVYIDNPNHQLFPTALTIPVTCVP